MILMYLVNEIFYQVIRWTDPGSEVELKKNTFYAPVRMEREAQAMASGYDSGRFNLADWFQFIRYPWHARFTDRAFFHTQQKIKQYEKLLKGQPFIRERLIALGPDLAAAYFLCHRNCRVRFKDRDDWTEMDMRTLKMPSYVPQGKLECKFYKMRISFFLLKSPVS